MVEFCSARLPLISAFGRNPGCGIVLLPANRLWDGSHDFRLHRSCGIPRSISGLKARGILWHETCHLLGIIANFGEEPS